MCLKSGSLQLIKENNSEHYRQITAYDIWLFDISLELLLAKLHAYGFSIAALRLIHTFLTNRKQKTKLVIQSLGGNFILCTTRIHFRTFIVQHLPAWSIFHNDFASYAGDKMLYRTVNTIDEVTKSIEHDSMTSSSSE